MSVASDDEQDLDEEHIVNGHGHLHGRHLRDEESDEEDGEEEEEDLEDDDDDEGDEYDSEDDENDEDDEEPALKYERITGGIPDLLKKDSASALVISHGLMVRRLWFLKYSLLTWFDIIGTWNPCWYRAHTRPDGKAHQVIQAPLCIYH
jgi:hypothetical protein